MKVTKVTGKSYVRKLHAKVTGKSYMGKLRNLQKLRKLRRLQAKVTRKNKKVPFLWNCAGAGVRQRKKLQKKDLQVSVSHGIMDSNKEPQQAVKEVRQNENL